MREKELSWSKHTGRGVIHHLSSALRAVQQPENPARFPVAEKHLEFAKWDLKQVRLNIDID